jgi:hypothetical protein
MGGNCALTITPMKKSNSNGSYESDADILQTCFQLLWLWDKYGNFAPTLTFRANKTGILRFANPLKSLMSGHV